MTPFLMLSMKHTARVTIPPTTAKVTMATMHRQRWMTQRSVGPQMLGLAALDMLPTQDCSHRSPTLTHQQRGLLTEETRMQRPRRQVQRQVQRPQSCQPAQSPSQTQWRSSRARGTAVCAPAAPGRFCKAEWRAFR